jgi:hypothetical protein
MPIHNPEALTDNLLSDQASLDRYLHTPRPLEEWDEEHGNVLWWAFPIEEPPYVGTPLDTGYTFSTDITILGQTTTIFREIGGWPGHHTHWTPLPSARKIQENYVPEAADDE